MFCNRLASSIYIGERMSSLLNDSSSATMFVFYDGACPLCKREINHYKRRRGAESIAWIDINDKETFGCYGLDKKSAMERFHVLDGVTWRLGASAFVSIWRRLPAYNWLAKLVSSLHLIPALDFLYEIFAEWRYNRQCKSGICGHITQQDV